MLWFTLQLNRAANTAPILPMIPPPQHPHPLPLFSPIVSPTFDTLIDVPYSDQRWPATETGGFGFPVTVTQPAGQLSLSRRFAGCGEFPASAGV